MSSQDQQRAVENFKYSKRVALKSILGRDDNGSGLIGQRVVVGGWVKSKKEKKDKGNSEISMRAEGEGEGYVTCFEVIFSRIPLLQSISRGVVKRDGGNLGNEEESIAPSVAYLRINDGSCVDNFQVVMDSSMSLLGQVMTMGTSILVEGVLEQPRMYKEHAVVLKAEKIIHVGGVDLNKYPLSKPRMTLESLRSYPHLRPRTTTVASITRIRNTLSYATHTFFHNNGFIYVHMPIITTTDIGDSSKMFQVTTLLNKSDDKGKLNTSNDRDNVSLELIKASVKDKSNKVEVLKRSDSNREALLLALQDLQKTNQIALQLEEKQKSILAEVEELDFSKDFFSRPAYLSVSAGLYLESYACALSSVYTFGPIFRAEDSKSKNQLAETWMVEIELAFAELEDAMNCAEDYLKFIIQSIMQESFDDLEFISKRIDNGCIDRLQSICSTPFARITYTEALEVLAKATDKTFETKLEWGVNLSEEHESYLANEVYKQPVIIYEYPKEIKPFYVHIKEDGKTASTFDIIAPKSGVLVRGSQKEERIDNIGQRMEELGLPREKYEWYLDIRRNGTVKHSGFSVGFENVFMFATRVDDIRDAIPFPRSNGCASP